MEKSTDGRVVLSLQSGVATVLFDRPHARNAMTPSMYEELLEHCRVLKALPDLRLAVLRGAGGKSFVSGSDIAQFTQFNVAEDGVAYEAKMMMYLDELAALPFPTIAVIEGFAVGGGLNIAACCDIRIATLGTRLGAPIARTVGNCLSIQNYARLVLGFGEGRARRMMLLGDLISAEEALAAGFLSKVCAAEEVDQIVADLCERLLNNAPLSMMASKAAINGAFANQFEDFDDFIRACYGSDDFKEGISAFLQKRTPLWRGR